MNPGAAEMSMPEFLASNFARLCGIATTAVGTGLGVLAWIDQTEVTAWMGTFTVFAGAIILLYQNFRAAKRKEDRADYEAEASTWETRAGEWQAKHQELLLLYTELKKEFQLETARLREERNEARKLWLESNKIVRKLSQVPDSDPTPPPQ